MLDPQQALFIKLKTEIEKLGYSVFDGCLPPQDTPYPFVYLGNCDQNDRMLKNAVIGSIQQTIHVWHSNIKQRGTVSKMLFDIKAILYRIEDINGLKWELESVHERIINDDTTKTPLLHGVLDVGFRFS